MSLPKHEVFTNFQDDKKPNNMKTTIGGGGGTPKRGGGGAPQAQAPSLQTTGARGARRGGKEKRRGRGGVISDQ
jgi:hypothetical protein